MEESLNPPDESKNPRPDTTSPGGSPGGHPQEPDRDHEVGYGKPPKETRFKKGQSGNPKNRQRPVKSHGKRLSQVFDEKVSASENGRLRKISKIQAIVKQAINGAVKGDRKSTQAVLRMVEQTLHRRGPKPPDSNPAARARDPGVILLLADNGYGIPENPELKDRLVRTARDWQIEQQRKQNAGNDNYDDSVWKLRKR